MQMSIEIFQDGACHNHKNQSSDMGIGVAVYIDQRYEEDLSRAIGVRADEFEDRGTSNRAEWLACVEAMKIAADLKHFFNHAHITVFSDSQIITNQFNREHAIRIPSFHKHFDEAHKYAAKAGVKKVKWIPREKNTQADKLSKEGIKLTKSNDNS